MNPSKQELQEEAEETEEAEQVAAMDLVELKRSLLLDQQRRRDELEELLEASRQLMREGSKLLPSTTRRPNRYGIGGQLPPFSKEKHIPLLALINSRSGAGVGSDILDVARRSPYYRDRFFDIIAVFKDRARGGLFDVFRHELNAAKEEARALGVRPRLISGGGDGTASFALSILFAALAADDSRVDEGLRDSGNGFIWTDEDIENFFPALAQMPLGTANDFGHVLGWGQKYPGSQDRSELDMLRSLQAWVQGAISPASKVVNFDMWGILPEEGADKCNFKLCELTGKKGMDPRVQVDGKPQLLMKEAGLPVPFIVCLYFSVGFGAEIVSRFQMNRRDRPWKNKLEYFKQGLGIVSQSRPPQVGSRLMGVEVDCEGGGYFPPQRGGDNDKGRLYREVGFYNINWQANMVHGADRAPACARLCSTREPVMFNDGRIDMYRMKFRSLVKNPGLKFQTDKREDMTLTYRGHAGQGIFFQWDGEARFAFSSTGQPIHIHIRRVLNVPVVLGPWFDPKVTGDPDNGQPVRFHFCGSTHAAREQVRQRILKSVRGELDSELNATQDEIRGAGLSHEP